MVFTESCTAPTFEVTDTDLPKIQEGFRQVSGLFSIRGKSRVDSYLGHKTTITPGAYTIPGNLLEPPRSTDLVLNVTLRDIYDERNNRCIILIYPDSDATGVISSTLNIATPSF
jgi:hypothetical protein